jgi:predicted nucleic acid-binding protein
MLLISDANILIDMEEGRVLQLMFRLQERFAVPNTLYEEELKANHSSLPTLGLQVLEVREEFVLEAQRLRTIYKRPSMNDLLALALAKQEACPLLTGDSHLRAAATQEQVQANGTLWLMERVWSEGLISNAALRHAYDLMLQCGRRLPVVEIEAQLTRLQLGQLGNDAHTLKS